MASDLPWRGQSPIWDSLSSSVCPGTRGWAARPHRSPRPPPAQFLKHSHKKQRYRPVVQNVESGYGPVFCCTEGPGVSQAGASPHIGAVRLWGDPSQLCHLLAEWGTARSPPFLTCQMGSWPTDRQRWWEVKLYSARLTAEVCMHSTGCRRLSITLAQTGKEADTLASGARSLIQGPGVLGPASLNGSTTVPRRYARPWRASGLSPCRGSGWGWARKSREDWLWE